MNLPKGYKERISQLALAAFAIIAINHVVGIIGLNYKPYHTFFESLSSINLLISFLLVVIFHQGNYKKLVLFCALAFIIGMLAEITGVNTGYPFGVYHYTNSFGPQLYFVPFIIGINWVLLSYITGMVVIGYFNSAWPKIMTASALMVLIDIPLELFATRHHFWVWQNDLPPVQNYIAWFLVSIPIQYLFCKLIHQAYNVQAFRYLIILISFLLIDFALAALQ